MYTQVDSEDRTPGGLRKEQDRLRTRLEVFLDNELRRHGGCQGEMCKTMMIGFFSTHHNILVGILTGLQVNTRANEYAVQMM